MFTNIISKKAVFATLTAAGLFGVAMLTLDVDIHVEREHGNPKQPGCSQCCEYSFLGNNISKHNVNSV